jgi:hypothetical protein
MYAVKYYVIMYEYIKYIHIILHRNLIIGQDWVWGPTRVLYNAWAVSLGIRWQGHEAESSLPTSAKVMNGAAILSVTNTSS